MMRFTSLIIFCLSAFTVAGGYHQATPQTLETLSLRLFKSPNDYTDVPVDKVLDISDKIDASKPTIVYLFGWLGFPDTPSAQAVITAYLDRQDHNVILADWSVITFGGYNYAAHSTQGVGKAYGNAFAKLIKAGHLDPKLLHLIGHSLGAQIAGYIGRFGNFTPARITGLDPAGPLYPNDSDHVNRNDADFVEVIHVDKGGIGSSFNSGTVDFWVNGGTSPQPGCILFDVCSHFRACYYYAESVRNSTAFLGLKCESSCDFNDGLCSGNERALMGFATPTTASGTFYLETNGKSPYGQGERGLYHVKNPEFSITSLVNWGVSLI